MIILPLSIQFNCILVSGNAINVLVLLYHTVGGWKQTKSWWEQEAESGQAGEQVSPSFDRLERSCDQVRWASLTGDFHS